MSGTYIMFFVPMIDYGFVQNPMFGRESVAWWVRMLPGYGPTEVLVDASFSERFDALHGLVLSLGYVAAAALIAALLFWQVMHARRRPNPVPSGALA